MFRYMITFYVLMVLFFEAQAVQPYTPTHPDPVLESWRWRSFSELKGLGQRCSVEDQSGQMWFGITAGVKQYDGVEWTTHTPEDGIYGAPVNVLCSLQDGSIYAGTEKGISRFRQGKWDKVFPPEGDLPWYLDDLMQASDGSIWAGTGWGALHLDGEDITLYTSRHMGSVISKLAPYVQVITVPDHAVPENFRRMGIQVASGGERGAVNRGLAPMVIWALSPGGAGEVAGLKVGDYILSVDGERVQRNLSERLFDASLRETAVTLTIKRKDRIDPFEIKVIPGQEIGEDIRPFGIFDVFEDQEGAIWFGLSGLSGVLGVIRVQDIEAGDDAWQLYILSQSPNGDVRSSRIAQTQDGMIWCSGGTGKDKVGAHHFDGKEWTRVDLGKLGGNNYTFSILVTVDGTLWIGSLWGYLHAYRDGIWKVYKSFDSPIPYDTVSYLLEASDGALWLGILGKEAVRLDFGNAQWTTYKGLHFQGEDADGTQWFIARQGQVYSIVSYDGKNWMHYGIEDGIMDTPQLIFTKGKLRAVGRHEKAAATAVFDGNRWFFKRHPQYRFFRAYEAIDGDLWFSDRREGVGAVLQYDGETLTVYPRPAIYSIGQTADGSLWFGGYSGLFRLDRGVWEDIKDPEELKTPAINVVYSAPGSEALWIGHRSLGLFHNNGKVWTHYNVQNGLSGNSVFDILEVDDGSILVETTQGTSRFDGQTWTKSAFPPPGIGGKFHQMRDGQLWVNGQRESISYKPDTSPPETKMTLVIDEVSQPGNTTLAWTASDKWQVTPDEELQYAYRLDGGVWSSFTKKTNDVFLSLPSGDHIFEVKARDLDFNEDPTPTSVHFTVIPPVWQQGWFIGMVSLFFGIAGLLFSRIIVRTTERDHARDALLKEAEGELQTAHDLQMNLMPTESPQIKGLELAGRCITANHVGGDFFQYFEQDRKLFVAMADVTGHAMDAAIPVVMFAGILDNQMEEDNSLEERFKKLNRSMHRTLDSRTFVCFTMGEISCEALELRLSNGGCPYPYHFKANTEEIVELQLDAYPLGVRAETGYEVFEVPLQRGDYVVFCSDGIAEAENSSDDQFGYVLTEETICQACAEGLSAEAVIDRILAVVEAFSDGAPQGDDMTCVVIKVEREMPILKKTV